MKTEIARLKTENAELRRKIREEYVRTDVIARWLLMQSNEHSIRWMVRRAITKLMTTKRGWR